MNSQNEIPLLLSHRLEGLVPQNTGVSNKDMDTAELLQGRLYNSFTIFRRANNSCRLSSGCIISTRE